MIIVVVFVLVIDGTVALATVVAVTFVLVVGNVVACCHCLRCCCRRGAFDSLVTAAVVLRGPALATHPQKYKFLAAFVWPPSQAWR